MRFTVGHILINIRQLGMKRRQNKRENRIRSYVKAPVYRSVIVLTEDVCIPSQFRRGNGRREITLTVYLLTSSPRLQITSLGCTLADISMAMAAYDIPFIPEHVKPMHIIWTTVSSVSAHSRGKTINISVGVDGISLILSTTPSPEGRLCFSCLNVNTQSAGTFEFI